jgi:hypothetical protein
MSCFLCLSSTVIFLLIPLPCHKFYFFAGQILRQISAFDNLAYLMNFDDDLLPLRTDSANIGTGKRKFREAATRVILANRFRFHTARSSFRRVSVRDIILNSPLLVEDALLVGEDFTEFTATSTEHAEETADKIDRAYDATSLKGKSDGLFRACMEAIRSLHHEARQIRMALIMLGLFTDPELYKDWLSIFYIVNLELENKIRSADFEESLGNDKNELAILKKLQKLGRKYYFSELYEKDLRFLLGVNTGEKLLTKVESCLLDKPNAREYRSVVKNMPKASDLAGALFCLWGVFIVGKLDK